MLKSRKNIDSGTFHTKGSSDSIGKSCEREIFHPIEVSETAEYCMYPQGVCRIRKPAYAGNGCAIFPVFDTEEWTEKIRSQPQTIESELPKERRDSHVIS